MLTIEESNIHSEYACVLINKLNLALESITGNSGESSFNTSEFCNEARDKNNFFLIARLNGEPIACGAIRELTHEVAEMKRVYAEKNSVGAARQLVKALEEKAVESGYQEIWVETRKVNTHAVNFYVSLGYSMMENYGKYIGRDEAVCMHKKLNENRNLPGFQKKSFVLPYGGGEIWCEHLDGMYERHDLVIKKLEEDKKSFLKPSMTSLFCVNLDETEVTTEIIVKIADILLHSQKQMRKVCFVGTKWITRIRIKKALQKRSFLLEFINDFEKAKEWLVS